MRFTSLRWTGVATGVLLALTVAGTASAAPINLRSTWTFSGSGGSGFATCTDGVAVGDGCAGTTYTAGTSGGNGLGFFGGQYDFSGTTGGLAINGALGSLENYTIDIVFGLTDFETWAKPLSFDGNVANDPGVWIYGPGGGDYSAFSVDPYGEVYSGPSTGASPGPNTLRVTRGNDYSGEVAALYWNDMVNPIAAPIPDAGNWATFLSNAAYFFSDAAGVDDIAAGSLFEIRFYEGSQLDQVPEPASMILMGTGLLGVANTIRRRRKQTQAVS